MSIIEISKLCKSYDSDKQVLVNIDLKIEEGDFIVLLGPSGCGKTTLLKIINRLIEFNSGEVKVYEKKLKDWDEILLRRKIGYVIQNIGLFPHLTVGKNITYVLELLKVPKETQIVKAKELLKLVQLDEDLMDKYPHELSGGQKQRIGVARALASDSDIVLMDEPFGAVDEIARTKLQDELIEIHKRLNKTIVFVTHDIHEAQKMASKIVLMNEGKIVQVGTPYELQFNPVDSFVKEFFGTKGFKNFLDDSKMEKLYEDVMDGKKELSNLFTN